MDHLEESEGRKNYSNEALARLEYITSDDYLTKMNAKIDAIEEQLSDPAITYQDCSNLIRRLNEEWMYMGYRVAVWGTMYLPSTEHPSSISSINYGSQIVAGEQWTSNGYTLLTFATSFDNEAILQRKIAYLFTDGEARGAMMRNAFSGDFPDSSPDMARRRLEYHFPDEAARIAEIASAGDEQPSATPILNFKGYSVKVRSSIPDHVDYINDLQTYLYQQMRFDRHLPYVIACELDEFDDGHDSSLVQIVASPQRIRLHYYGLEESGEHAYLPWIDLSVYDIDSSKPNTTLTVPLHGLYCFDSVRKVSGGDYSG